MNEEWVPGGYCIPNGRRRKHLAHYVVCGRALCGKSYGGTYGLNGRPPILERCHTCIRAWHSKEAKFQVQEAKRLAREAELKKKYWPDDWGKKK